MTSMVPTRRSARRRRRSHRKAKFLAGMAAAAALMMVFAALAERIHTDRRTALMRDAAARQTVVSEPEEQPVRAADTRAVYPYSIIKGGAHSPEELKAAIQTDPVVAAHFKEFDLSKVRVERLQAPPSLPTSRIGRATTSSGPVGPL